MDIGFITYSPTEWLRLGGKRGFEGCTGDLPKNYYREVMP